MIRGDASVNKGAILIVEEEALVARDLERSLESMGYEVVGIASSYEEALLAAAKRRPDMVLMDVRIGALDGIDTAEELRRRYRAPVIYLTSSADEETLTRALRTDPGAYIVKPVTGSAVRVAIEATLAKFRADTILAERERWVSTTLEALKDAVIACDATGSVKVMNQAAEALTGWREHEARGRNVGSVVQILSANSGELLANPVALALRSHTVQRVPKDAQLVERGADRVRDIEASAAPIVHENGVLGAVLVFRDITEQRHLQGELALTDRLRSLGALAASVTHEISNPLTATLFSIEHAIGELKTMRAKVPEEDVRQLETVLGALTEARDGASRIARIVSDFRPMSRSVDDAPRELVDVNAAVEWGIRLTQNQVRHVARLVVDLQAVPPVLANDVRLSQVVVNLLTNAAQAVSGPVDLNEIRVSTHANAAHVVITVSDTGHGIPRHLLPRLFERFFTTKLGMGAGLGLAICRDIVTSFGGDLTVDTEVGRGSTFRVSLPIAANMTPRAGSTVPVGARRANIVVVDDEDDLRHRIQRMLEKEHEVTAFPDGARALAALRKDSDVDVILCDLMMPAMNGMEFFAALERELPELVSAVIFTTGGAFTEEAALFAASTTRPVLSKPFAVAALTKLIAKTLTARHRDYRAQRRQR